LSAGQGSVASLVVQWRATAPSVSISSKGKRITSPYSANFSSFKRRRHMASDEGPSSPKLISDFAPFYAEAREALFGSLASTNNLGDSNTFLLGVEEARSCHDVLRNLSYPDIQCGLDGLTLLELANFHDVADLRLRDEVVVLKKQQFESARVVSKLVVDLEKAKDGQGFRESMFGCDLKDEDSRLLKDRFEEKEVVYLSTEASLRSKIDVLNDKLKLANQEQSLLVRYFFPHAVERLLSSDLFSSVLADLQEKAMLVGRSQALRRL
ncbi:hypothetical protein Tco_1298332, partial [Tanacetum coccineum]